MARKKTEPVVAAAGPEPEHKFSHGDIVQVTSKDSKHFARIVVVHEPLDDTQQLSCYETSAGGQPIKVIVAQHEVVKVGVARLKWPQDKPIPAARPAYDHPLDKV